MLLPAHRYFQPLHFQEPQPRHDSPSPQITIWPFKAVGTSKVREKKEQMHHLAPTVANNAAGGRNGWNWSVYIYIYYICRHRSSIIKHCLSHRVSHTEPHMLGRPKKDSEDLVNWSRVFVSAPADDTSTTFQISTHSFLSVQVIFKSLTQVGLLHPYLRKPKIVNFKWLKNECNPPPDQPLAGSGGFRQVQMFHCLFHVSPNGWSLQSFLESPSWLRLKELQAVQGSTRCPRWAVRIACRVSTANRKARVLHLDHWSEEIGRLGVYDFLQVQGEQFYDWI